MRAEKNEDEVVALENAVCEVRILLEALQSLERAVGNSRYVYQAVLDFTKQELLLRCRGESSEQLD